MKKILAVLLALSICVALSACSGVTQEEYDKLQQDYQTLQQEKDTLQASYETLNEAHQKLEGDYNELQETSAEMISADEVTKMLYELKLPTSSDLPPFACAYSKDGHAIPISIPKAQAFEILGKNDNENDGWLFWYDSPDVNAGIAISFDASGKAQLISISDSSVWYVYGAKIGDSKSDVTDSWGTPDKDDGDEIIYLLDVEGHQTDSANSCIYWVIFSFENNKLNMIALSTQAYWD